MWQKIAADIALDAGGQLMLDVLCEAWDRRQEARAAIRKSGAVVTDRFQQQKPSPWTAIERDSTLAIQRAYHALGLDLEVETD